MKRYFVYILTNWNKKLLYVGVTNNILRRTAEHESGLIKGFTQKYKIYILVYFEEFDNPTQAIKREKQLKHWSHKEKMQLITKNNPSLRNLYSDVFQRITHLV